MQQRFGVGGIVKVAGLAPQDKVGNKSCAGSNMLAQLLQFCCLEDERAAEQASREHEREGGEDASDTPSVKLHITETSLFQTAKYDSANQKSRDDEKNIDPDKTTFNPFWKRVEPHNGNTATARRPSMSGRYEESCRSVG